MVWPFARAKGGSNSSVAVLIAVEMKALISAAWAVAVAASMAMTITTMRMTVPPRTQLPIILIASTRVGREVLEQAYNLPPSAGSPPVPLTVGLRHATSPGALKRAEACRDVRAWRVE